jgi:hypothetical protein
MTLPTSDTLAAGSKVSFVATGFDVSENWTTSTLILASVRTYGRVMSTPNYSAERLTAKTNGSWVRNPLQILRHRVLKVRPQVIRM